MMMNTSNIMGQSISIGILIISPTPTKIDIIEWSIRNFIPSILKTIDVLIFKYKMVIEDIFI